MRLQFGKGHLDRIEIGRVSRQEEEPGPSLPEAFSSSFAFVNGEIVENDDITTRERWGKLSFDPGVESGAVNGLVDHPWGRHLVVAQAGDESLCAPMAEGGVGPQPLAAMGAPTKPDHLRSDRGFIDKHETVRLEPHPGLPAVDPEAPFSPDVGACGFRRQQCFFYM